MLSQNCRERKNPSKNIACEGRQDLSTFRITFSRFLHIDHAAFSFTDNNRSTIMVSGDKKEIVEECSEMTTAPAKAKESTWKDERNADDCSTTSIGSSIGYEFCAPCNPMTLSLASPRHIGVQDNCMECLICWDGMTEDDGPHDYLPCGHAFHRACINDWRYQNQTCPTCRVNLEFAEMHC